MSMTINNERFNELMVLLWGNETIMHEATSICTYRDECRPTDYEAAFTAAFLIYDAFGDNWDRHSNEEFMYIIDDTLLAYMADADRTANESSSEMVHEIYHFEQLIDRILNDQDIMHDATGIYAYRNECMPATNYEAASAAAMLIYEAFGEDWDRHSNEEMQSVIHCEVQSILAIEMS